MSALSPLRRPGPISVADRLAADVFEKSYREFIRLKPTHYRWSHLAPQSVGHLQSAVEQNWSEEKLADYMHCPVEEAAACLRRYKVSKKVNGKEGAAARIRQAFFEWVGGLGEMDDKEKEKLAGELSLIVANQLYTAVASEEDLLAVSRDLEGDGKKPDAPSKALDSEPPKWGPQWKD